MIIQYFYNLILAGSQMINTLCGGHPDESTSQNTARKYLEAVDRGDEYGIKYYGAKMDAIDFLFDNPFYFIEMSHTLRSLHGESGAKDIRDGWVPKRGCDEHVYKD